MNLQDNLIDSDGILLDTPKLHGKTLVENSTTTDEGYIIIYSGQEKYQQQGVLL